MVEREWRRCFQCGCVSDGPYTLTDGPVCRRCFARWLDGVEAVAKAAGRSEANQRLAALGVEVRAMRRALKSLHKDIRRTLKRGEEN